MTSVTKKDHKAATVLYKKRKVWFQFSQMTIYGRKITFEQVLLHKTSDIQNNCHVKMSSIHYLRKNFHIQKTITQQHTKN